MYAFCVGLPDGRPLPFDPMQYDFHIRTPILQCLTDKFGLRQQIVEQTIAQFGQLTILVNNAANQHIEEKIEDITEEQLSRTFETSIYGYFFMVQTALPHLHAGDSIINTGSIVGKMEEPKLVD